jgi:hypothetical protein
MNENNDFKFELRLYDEPEGFKIQEYSKTELGHLYYPDLHDKQARQAFYRMLCDAPRLQQRLKQHGYNKYSKKLCPLFVKMIVDTFGPPY